MMIFIGFIAVFFLLLYKRSTGIIVVNPLSGSKGAVQRPDGESQKAVDFASLLNTIQEAAKEAQRQSAPGGRLSSDQSKAAILQLVRSNRIREAIQAYRSAYGTDLQTARDAIEEMIHE